MAHEDGLVTRWVDLDGATAVAPPYADGDLEMWVVVPDAVDGLAEVEAGLTADRLTSLGDEATGTGSVGLRLPTWTTELPSTDLLGGWLCPEGLCPGAPFEGIAPDLGLGTALHGAMIIVDEKGTEAAAATAMDFETSAPEFDLVLTVDRPFLHAVVHAPTRSLLFVGRVVDPTTTAAG